MISDLKDKLTKIMKGLIMSLKICLFYFFEITKKIIDFSIFHRNHR